METDSIFRTHLSVEDLEEYAFQRVPEEIETALEMHLLLCDSCRRELEAIEGYIGSMKAAIRTQERQEGRRRIRGAELLPGLLTPHLMVSAGTALAACLALVVWLSPMNLRGPASPITPATVSLASFRGGEADGFAGTPAGRPLELAIDADGVPPADRYRIEVVTGTGKPVWNGVAGVSQGKISARMPAGLRVGLYWVRLYTLDSMLLGEFGLNVN